MTEKIIKSDDEWEKLLTHEQFDVTRKKRTEPPFTGRYYNCEEEGLYRCVCCGNELFNSKTKFESGTGWPSFHSPESGSRHLLQFPEGPAGKNGEMPLPGVGSQTAGGVLEQKKGYVGQGRHRKHAQPGSSHQKKHP